MVNERGWDWLTQAGVSADELGRSLETVAEAAQKAEEQLRKPGFYDRLPMRTRIKLWAVQLRMFIERAVDLSR